MTSDQKIVPLSVRHGSVSERKSSAPKYPQVAEPEQVERRLADIAGLLAKLSRPRLLGRTALKELINEAHDALALNRSANLAERIRQMGKPATMSQVAVHIVNLIASDPRDDIVEPEVYCRNMQDDVGALQPSRYAVEAGCRHIRRTLKFRPKIAEVYAAVEEAERRFQGRVRDLDRLSAYIARAETELRDLEESLRQADERRETQKATLRAGLAEGREWRELIRTLDWDVTSEIRQEMQAAAAGAPTNEERRRLLRLVDADVPTPEELEAEREVRRAKQEAEAAETERVTQEVHENLKARWATRLEIMGRLERGETVDEFDEFDVVKARMAMTSKA